MRPMRRLDAKKASLPNLAAEAKATRYISQAALPKRARSIPREPKTLKQNLLAEYGSNIHEHLMKLESQLDQADYLYGHAISCDYRAKMVDWMVEVMNTFKCSDQSFFIATSVMDRYFKEA